MQVAPGSMIAGRFRLERPLAKGGMGEVWVASDVSLDVPVALKFMSPAAVGSPELVARFELEAKSAAKLRHPQVVQILAHGVDRGTPFIAMELLEGEDLGARLKARGRLTLQETARLVGEIARPLHRAHSLKLIHRDLKPANVFLCKQDDDEVVKVLDFGVAKSVAEAAAIVTKSGAIVGSPHYMSPEQARRSDRLDHRTDLWALAVIAFRAVTGRLPFPGTNVIDVLMAVAREVPPAPSSIAPDLGQEVDRFFARAFARAPEDRFQTARELADAIAALAGLSAEGQPALNRSWSEDQAPSPRGSERNWPRAPAPTASDRGSSRAPEVVSDAGDSVFDNATTVPLASAAAQRAIADKPWVASVATTGIAPEKGAEASSPRRPSPPVRPATAIKRAEARTPEQGMPRVILSGDTRGARAGASPGASGTDSPARKPLSSVPEVPALVAPPADATPSGLGTLTGSGAEVPAERTPSPRQDRTWMILVGAGAAVMIVLVVIGAVLATSGALGSGDDVAAAPADSGTESTSGGQSRVLTPGWMAPVEVKQDKAPGEPPPPATAPSTAPVGSGSDEEKISPRSAGVGGGNARPPSSAPSKGNDKPLNDEARKVLGNPAASTTASAAKRPAEPEGL